MADKKSGVWIRAMLAAGSFAALAWVEGRRPLRSRTEPKLRREVRNLAVAALGAASMQLVGAPAVVPLTRYVERRGWGLLPRLRLPRLLKLAAALLLMDYTFYLWHVLAHRMQFLWRFHLVHHLDMDLDASTALRFHFGELMAGIPWQAAQIVLIGLDPRAYSTWQAVFLICIVFHHSSVKIPIQWERPLSWFLVTPRMHGIHHSVVEEETNSNWSSGLNVWDRLHGTLRLNVPQREITIGVPAYRGASSVALANIVPLPFQKLKPSWVFPDQTAPEPHQETVPRSYLLA